MGLCLALCLALSLSVPPVRAQDASLQHVEQAFASGDAQALVQQAGNRVEVSLLGTTTLYSRSQAQYVLQEFFRQYPPRAFTLERVSTTEGSTFADGDYYYEHEERPLRVFLRLHPASGQRWEIREIRIEERFRE